MALVDVRAVSKTYGGVTALRDVSFELRAGEVHALVGENGAGKSTLVGVITGAVTPDAGGLTIDGRVITGADPGRIRALGVAPIYQQPALFPDLTIAENLAIGVEPQGAWRTVDWRRRRARGAAMLEHVGAQLDLDAPARTIGAAEQQLVEIARALGADARILVMDEPTASLTSRETNRLFDVLRTLRRKGVGILYISHRLEEISLIADRISILRDGAMVATREAASVSRGEMIRLMLGREIEALVSGRPGRSGGTPVAAEVALALDAVGCRPSGIHDVTLELHRGEVLGLAGLVGAGRTELARVLFGLTPADAGEIRVGGQRVHLRRPSDAVRAGLAYVPEDRRHHGVIGELSVAANTTLAALDSITRAGFLDVRRERALASAYVQQLAIKTATIDVAVATLSGGNQQKVALARWLAVAPKILIVDEPTQGIDVGTKAEIHRMLVALAAQGLAILFISSDLPEVLTVCDRVAVMRRGTIAGTLASREATEAAVLELAFGTAAVETRH
jgi:rhamnose transport system ATP-binding protein